LATQLGLTAPVKNCYSLLEGKEVKMKNSGTINSKWQVTVPQEIRTRLSLSPGDRLDFVIEGERTLIRPARFTPNPFEKYRGVLGTFPGGKKEINAWLDELRREDSRNRGRHHK
jgi:antitoxin PrlF